MRASLSILLDHKDPEQPKCDGGGHAAFQLAELVLDQTLARGLRKLDRYIEGLYPEDDPIEWASPGEGLGIVAALRKLAADHPNAIESIEKVEADLACYQRVLDHAEKVGAKWMFYLDA